MWNLKYFITPLTPFHNDFSAVYVQHTRLHLLSLIKQCILFIRQEDEEANSSKIK